MTRRPATDLPCPCEGCAARIRALQTDIDNYAEALHDLGVADWDTSEGARGLALARAEQIAALIPAAEAPTTGGNS